MALNTFTVGVNSITFTQAPSDGAIDGVEKYQQHARGSDGEFFLYNKSIISRNYNLLSFSCQTLAKKDEALIFFELYAQGWKELITWTDHLNVTRTVKNRNNAIDWTKDSSNEYTINIEVEEVT